MKRVELRTSFAKWFGNIAYHHKCIIADLTKNLYKAKDQERVREIKEKIREHQKIVDSNLEERRRYLLQARVCGDEVLVIR